jgi:hypothetical protein
VAAQDIQYRYSGANARQPVFINILSKELRKNIWSSDDANFCLRIHGASMVSYGLIGPMTRRRCRDKRHAGWGNIFFPRPHYFRSIEVNRHRCGNQIAINDNVAKAHRKMLFYFFV